MELAPVELTLEELAVRAQTGAGGERDRYFSMLVQRLQGRLESFLLRRTGRAQDVDDLVQETFLRAYSNLESYQPRWRFSTWIFTIASRLASNQQRNQKRRMALLSAETPPVTPVEDPAVLVAERQESARLWATAKEHLSDAQYRALWLHYCRDMSIKDIAQATGRTALHVRVLLYRARRKLAKEVACSVR